MRLVYGVMGFGRGHATRTAAVLPDLLKNHDVLVLAGGDAYDYLSRWGNDRLEQGHVKGKARPRRRLTVEKIPMIGYQYNDQGEFDLYRTLDVNLRLVFSVIRKGPELRHVVKRMREFRADVVVSDSELLTHRAARELRLPRISFDHIGMMVYGQPKLSRRDQFLSRRDIEGYKLLMGRADRVICCGFYPMRNKQPIAHQVGAILRDEVIAARDRISNQGHLLVYFNKGDALLGPRPRVLETLQTLSQPVILYGMQREAEETVGNITFKPLSKQGFLEDLAGCHALLSTAGNQLCGEAIYLGKPLMVVPDDSVEQRMNAEALVEMGVGERGNIDRLNSRDIEVFLAARKQYEFALRRHRSNGRADAVRLLEQFIAELVGTVPPEEFEPNMAAKVVSILPHLAAAHAIGLRDQLSQQRA